MGRAVVTFARSWPALTITRSLGRRGIEVFCGDEAPFAASFFSKYCKGSFQYPSPRTQPDAFLSFLEKKVQELKPHGTEPYVLLPVHSETFLVAKHRERFEKHACLALPEYEKIKQTHDKGSLSELAARLKVPIPKTYQFRSLKEVYRAVPDLTFPLFLKLREAASGVGVTKCRSPEELISRFKKLVDSHSLTPENFPLVQEFIPGKDYCVTALFDHGRFVAAMTYRNIRSFPRGTGAGALRETTDLPEAERHTRRLLESLEWHGIAEADWRVDPSGRAFLIEINPRFFGGLSQAVASNVDYPYLLFRIAAGSPIREPPNVIYGVRTEPPLVGLLSTLEEIAHDERLLGRLKEAHKQLKALVQTPLSDLRIKPFWEALRKVVQPSDIKAVIKEALEQHANTVNDVFQSEDPKPALGLLFPLALMLKHGRVSLALVTGEEQPQEKRPEIRLRDLLKRPRWRTVFFAAGLLALSIFAQNASFTKDNLGIVLSLPLKLSEGIFGRLSQARTDTLWGAVKYTACHGFHFFLWYVVAALLLRFRRRIKAAPKGRGK